MTQVNLQFLSVKVIFVEIFVQFEWTLVFFTKYGHMCSTGISEVRLLCMKPAKHMQAKGSVIHSFLDGQYSQSIVSILLRTSMNVNLFSIV